MNKPTVVSIRAEACEEYIGRFTPGRRVSRDVAQRTREAWRGANGSLLASRWANPFTFKRHGAGDPTRVVTMFRELMGLRCGWLLPARCDRAVVYRWESQLLGPLQLREEDWRRWVLELAGRRLGCWCEPASIDAGLCHGCVIVETWERLTRRGG